MLISYMLATAIVAAPPPTHVEPVTETMHGEAITDDYRWLEAPESESERVRDWTSAQNSYTRDVLDHLPGRDALEDRLRELLSMDSFSTPVVRGGNYFYLARSGDENQPRLMVRRGHDGAPRVLIDPNTLDDRGLYTLQWFEPSYDGSVLAFGLSYADDEMTVLYLLDVSTGTWLADEIPGKVSFGGWSPDGGGFLYSRLADPENAYTRCLRYHAVGAHHRQDPTLYSVTRPEQQLGGSLSRDGRWITIVLFAGWARQDLLAIDVEDWKRTGVADAVPLITGRDAMYLPQLVNGNWMYVLTTEDAPNGRLIAIDLEKPGAALPTIIGERSDAVLKKVVHVGGELVAAWEQDVAARLTRHDLDGAPIGSIELPGLGNAGVIERARVTPGIAGEPDRGEAFYAYTSYNEPTTIYRVDLASGASSVWARPDVPVDCSRIEVKQEWCTSADGTRVPMFIVHRRGLDLDGANPTAIYGYGGFNQSVRPRFAATDFPWLENGGVYVSVTLRGGGEYGESWHRAGMLEHKQNVFDDLYAAAEHLIRRGYTSPEHLAVRGGSNGGLLTGVAAMQRPELWAAVVSGVPLLDMLRYHKLLMARYWVPEYGDPDDPAHFRWLRAYSPYHNITPGQRYPAMLITAGENDTRVHPMHARKMTAALQARAGNDLGDDPVLLWVDREGGHGHGKPVSTRVRDLADRWGFIMWQTGLEYQGR